MTQRILLVGFAEAKGDRWHPNGNAKEEEEAIATHPLRREPEIELFYYGSFSLHLLIGRYVGYYLLCNLFSRAASHRQVRNFPFFSPKASASQMEKKFLANFFTDGEWQPLI